MKYEIIEIGKKSFFVFMPVNADINTVELKDCVLCKNLNEFVLYGALNNVL